MATKSNKSKKISSTVAKSKDGTIQITLSIPFKDIKKEREKAAKELGKDIEVPGFRKGNAPLGKLLTSIPQNKLVEETLRGILPEFLGKVITEHKLKIASYPKFEIISVKENENWQIRATTCELPKISVDNYKKIIKGAGKSKVKKKTTKEEKEQVVINALIKDIKLEIPKPLIDDEVEKRLSDLLQRIEKLGLTLDGYLKSINKKPEELRTDYEKQVKEVIKLELVLNEIGEKEKVKASKKEIDKTMKAYSSTQNMDQAALEEQKRVVTSVLKKRATLDALIALL